MLSEDQKRSIRKSISRLESILEPDSSVPETQDDPEFKEFEAAKPEIVQRRSHLIDPVELENISLGIERVGHLLNSMITFIDYNTTKESLRVCSIFEATAVIACEQLRKTRNELIEYAYSNCPKRIED